MSNSSNKREVELSFWSEITKDLGEVNLIIIDNAALLWKTVLYLYMKDDNTLPTQHKVVVCTETTTNKEVKEFWNRAVSNKNKLHCLVSAEKLQQNICDEILNDLENTIQRSPRDFKITVLIVKEDQFKNSIASRLNLYLREMPVLPANEKITQYVSSIVEEPMMEFPAVSSNHERELIEALSKAVHVVTSTCPGMGKSLRIKRMAEMIPRVSTPGQKSYINVPIFGSDVSVNSVLELMEDCIQCPYPQLIHFDLNLTKNASDLTVAIKRIERLLFQILILGELTDNVTGISWKRGKQQVCVVECTLMKTKDTDQSQNQQTNLLLSYFPQTHCLSPREINTGYKDFTAEKFVAALDENVFREKKWQRVYQYLKRKKDGLDFAEFHFSSEQLGTVQECLDIILRSMSSNGTVDPSWSEVKAFVELLDIQLCDFEKSLCSVVDELKRFKDIFVTFAILMAKEFTKPSLNTLEWNPSSHPYLFINKDGFTITILGQWADHHDLGLINFSSTSDMGIRLRKLLEYNRVSFESHSTYNRDEMILKLARVVGIDEIRLSILEIDPNRTYVLADDNLLKMIAIHMKFRCGIPVILMGKTGCGKTRLIQYLCELKDNALHKAKTLIYLKVHPAMTENELHNEIEAAIKQAENNKRKCNYTVLFFDEVNTTEALGLIKQVMCDRTLYGKPIPDELKFAAACNPYKIHEERVIRDIDKDRRLRSIEFGDVPLQKLMYHVFSLPLSMHQYVYNFDNVSDPIIEKQYIENIVHNELKDLKNDNDQKAIVTIIWECQKFMREQMDVNKHVSLRDVVRFMKIFKWFLEKVDFLKKGLLMETRQHIDVRLENTTHALAFSVAVCYYARLVERDSFLKKIIPLFTHEYVLPGRTIDEKIFFWEKEVKRIQSIFLDAMNISSNVIHNDALCESIFMMVVCIENRIPLFMIGIYDTLTLKSIIGNSMKGSGSYSRLLHSCKQVQIFSHLCNKTSTRQSITKVFDDAKNVQQSQDKAKFVSLVFLEDISSTEESPGLPLNVLHCQLEDKCQASRDEEVAFIGISKWFLDPGKMNRGIVLNTT